jgi:hypothetical protein
MTTKKRRSTRSQGRLAAAGVLAGAVAFVALVVGTIATSGGDAPSSGPGIARPAAASELESTGEVNAMGLPVIETPGYTSGVATVAGVTVQGANWEMGRVPLDVAVRPFWTLTNTGRSTIELGEPEAEVRAGCCPGAFALGARSLDPGDSTLLTFELAMHEGMDGWHDMGVHVPVESRSGRDVLELNVTGDFRT